MIIDQMKAGEIWEMEFHDKEGRPLIVQGKIIKVGKFPSITVLGQKFYGVEVQISEETVILPSLALEVVNAKRVR